jgi:ABC-type amino acid transport system permease subunit
LLQLLFVWNALPQLWPVFSESWFTPFLAAFITLALNEAAYMSEIVRAGLMSVDPGQELAGRALGMSRPTILRRVILLRPSGSSSRPPATSSSRCSS